jgi:hypothetical protein
VEDTDARHPREWTSYAAHTLIVDGIALGVFLAGAASESDELMMLGVATYGLGPPVVHASHGRFGRAWGSFGVRVGAPLLGVQVGGYEHFIEGAAVGVAAAIAIDALLLARKPGPTPAPAARVQLVPALRASRSGVSLGMAGLF